MFALSPRLTAIQTGFLVGFLEAEAHFGIVPSNAGASYSCVMTLAARDDDTELLVALRAATGLGTLRPRTAKDNSHSQVIWTIGTQNEAAELATLLSVHGPIGRKAQVVAVWCEAVRTWCATGRAKARHLGRQRERLRLVSQYSASPATACSLDLTDAHDRGYVTGLTVGDGHLSVTESGAALVIHLRDDDLPLLESLQGAFGGKVRRDRAYGTSRPAARWTVRASSELDYVRSCLAMELFPSRKQREFTIWSKAIDEQISAEREQRCRNRVLLSALQTEIRSERVYRAPSTPLQADRRARTRAVTTRAACASALAAFSAEHEGTLAATAYDRVRRERHPAWPQRETVARHFGGWHAALEAMGLSDRSARTAETYANRPRANLEVRRAQQRQRVLESVRRFADHIGRQPRAMEYFRWRLARDPDTPTQATVYTLFPGGWPTVLESLAELEHDTSPAAADRALRDRRLAADRLTAAVTVLRLRRLRGDPRVALYVKAPAAAYANGVRSAGTPRSAQLERELDVHAVADDGAARVQEAGPVETVLAAAE